MADHPLLPVGASAVLTDAERERLATMLQVDVMDRLRAANEREDRAWAAVRSKEDWERFLAPRLEALRRSLGTFPPPPAEVPVEVTGTVAGDGFVVENLVFESRPGLPVTANLYRPSPPPSQGGAGGARAGVEGPNDTGAKPCAGLPGLLIVHSHHNPKTHGELQDMGMTWARLGCLVLVPDMISHGERRQQPYGGREDYHHRYILGMQLHVLGDSLIGWMAWDLWRSLDVLAARMAKMGMVQLARKKGSGTLAVGSPTPFSGRPSCRSADSEPRPKMRSDPRTAKSLMSSRGGLTPFSPGETGASPRLPILMLGSVAGGGDPQAVAAALDPRVTCSVPFNLGHAERPPSDPRDPASPPYDNLIGSGSWESTRNLRLTAPGGFIPWVIVAAVAPRHLVSAHEFAWNPEVDTAWQRTKHIYEWYGVPERLGYVHGWGSVRYRWPEGSHCNHIGLPQRRLLHPLFERWFGIPAPAPEYQNRLEADKLTCLTPAAKARFKPRPVHALARDLAQERLAAARQRLSALPPPDRARRLRDDWSRLLGTIEPKRDPETEHRGTGKHNGLTVERHRLEVEPGIVVPLVLLRPEKSKGRTPAVIAVAQEGKEGFLTHRAAHLAGLAAAGVAVCLPDLRGTGETRPERDHGWQVESQDAISTTISSYEWMLGESLLGGRLRDLRSVLRWLRSRNDADPARIGLWGDSFAPTNPDEFEDPPLRTDRPPHLAEPLGALVALLGALFEPQVKAVVARRGLVGFASILDSWMIYVPHDVIVPGVLETGDVADVAAALAPRHLRIEDPVDGRNRRVIEGNLDDWFGSTREAYAGAPDRFTLCAEERDDLAEWLVAGLS